MGASFAGYGLLRHLEKGKRRIYPAISDDIPYSGFFLGCGVSCSSSSSWHYSTGYAQRFRAERSGRITAVRWWNKASDETSILRGEGGVLQVELRRDDGEGSPSATVLAQSEEIASPVYAGKFPLVTLKPPVRLQKSLHYHIVYNQLAPEKGSASIGECRSFAEPSDMHPYFEGALASFRLTDDVWERRPSVYPVFEVHYEDGIIKGQGYLLEERQDPQRIGAPSVVRQSFRATGGDFDVAAIHVRLYRANDSGKNLSLRFEVEDGSVIEAVSILEAEVALDPELDSPGSLRYGRKTTWVRKALAQPYRMNEGDVCRVVISAPEEARYYIHAMQNGRNGWSRSAGFAEDKLHAAEMPRAEFSTDNEDNWQDVGASDNVGHFDYPVLLEFV